eukprot:gene2320-1696_t
MSTAGELASTFKYGFIPVDLTSSIKVQDASTEGGLERDALRLAAEAHFAAATSAEFREQQDKIMNDYLVSRGGTAGSFPGVEIEKLVFTADMGLLLGSPDSSYILNRIVSLLSPGLSESRTSPKLPTPVSSSSIPTQSMMKVLPDIHASATQAVPTIAEPSVLSFYEDHFVSQTPVVLTHCADDWPALSNPERSWQNLSYISEVAGYRTVPIETGQTYHAKDAGTRLLTIEEFIQSYIMPGHDTLPPINSTSSDSLGHDDAPTFSSAPCGYLAQHELLEQIPALKKDIVIPDFCSLLLDEDEMAALDDISSLDVVHSAASVNDPKEIMIQAWFGPLGTVSPLHFDAYHNILVQLSGYKFIRLYPPTESSKLYPMSGRMTNNSQVDLQQYYGALLNGNSDEEYWVDMTEETPEKPKVDVLLEDLLKYVENVPFPQTESPPTKSNVRHIEDFQHRKADIIMPDYIIFTY